jgi:hypothetical protein
MESTPFAEALLPTRHDAIAPTGHRSGSWCASQAGWRQIPGVNVRRA